MPVTGIGAIETSWVKSYSANVELLVQQMGSKLRGTVQTQNFTGEYAAFIDQVGEVSAQLKTSRHADTPLVPTPMDRRWVTPKDYEVADLIDSQDRLRAIIDPTSPFARAQAAAIGRSMDDEIIEGILGNNLTGQDAGTTTAFPSGNNIAASSTGLTIDKLRTVRENMLDNDVDFEMEEVFAIITPKQSTQLLETTEITSSDYNTVKALVQGQLDSFMGFKFIVSNRILGASNYNGSQTETSNEETALFYPRSAVALGIWNDISARVDERPDKSYATQVYCKGTFGGTRLQEDKVFTVDTLTTA